MVATQTRKAETRPDGLEVNLVAAGELSTIVCVLARDMRDNSSHVPDQALSPKVRRP